MQAIHNAIGQLQDPFFYGNGVKTTGLYNAFTAEAFIRRMDAIRMRHHPMEDETAINRTAENLRDGAENWWLAICDTEPDRPRSARSGRRSWNASSSPSARRPRGGTPPSRTSS
jgi:hypothetical protein